MVSKRQSRLNDPSGTALIVSVLVLMVLSALATGLMLTTTVETDIATNDRWNEMAFFNADAALEYGKNVLAMYSVQDGDFAAALPPPRGPGEMEQPPSDTQACPDPSQGGCRDYQYWVEDQGNRIYIGRVLREPDGRIVQFDHRLRSNEDTAGDIDGDGNVDVQGTATLCVRRPTLGEEDLGYSDNRNDVAILTAEGTAPNYQGVGVGRATSIRRLEVTLRIPPTGIAGDEHADETKGSDKDSKPGAAELIMTTVH
jgi:hypothetical protein